MSLYIIDASIWISAWRLYPPALDVFRPIWDGIEKMIADGELRCPEEIREELERGTDGLPLWLKPRDAVYAEFDAELEAGITLVMDRFGDMVDPDSDKNKGDPFVVALAKAKNGTVVTGEKPRKHHTARPKIPDACSGLGVPCLKWLEFLGAADVAMKMKP